MLQYHLITEASMNHKYMDKNRILDRTLIKIIYITCDIHGRTPPHNESAAETPY
uniref:Uncharacterized protein n=1 Tax=Arundo donax TaxID=35708 RepID=A0A0A9C0T1_ARUDO